MGWGIVSSNVSRKVGNPIFNGEVTIFKCCQLIYRLSLKRVCPYTKFGFYVSKFQPLFSFLKTLVYNNCSRNLLSGTCIFTHEPDIEFAPHKRYGTELAQGRAVDRIHVGAMSSSFKGSKLTWWLQSYRKFNIHLLMLFAFALNVLALLLHGNLKNLIIASHF